ncbi:addiction module toxin RelE [Candidatus Woesearchaeota archaeon CG10_big_fil_rev_8_21_14_0_10_45_16]|nr:MAG: addiction module toxin RelE [Candidatus Woesearchaeota archaeon CG10_big_fil_rev_8_21_14_0_10_45_16]
MSYEVIWDDKARNFLRKIHKDDAKRIVKKVNSIVDDPRHYLETLVEIKSYKLRIGDFRALIDLDENKQTISVVLVGHRKDVYKYVQRSGFRRKN